MFKFKWWIVTFKADGKYLGIGKKVCFLDSYTIIPIQPEINFVNDFCKEYFNSCSVTLASTNS